MKNNIKKNIFSFLMLLVVLFSSIFSITNSSVVNGAIIGSNKYTDVMQDLQSDNTFNIEDYAEIENDYSINVIAISESSDKELFVYTYEPCGDSCNLQASSINISQELHNRINVNNYSLLHLSSNGVFGKYLVKGLAMRNNATRYYEIVSIYRRWNVDIDEESGNDNIIDEIAYNVGKTFTASTTSDGIKYGVSESETLELTGYKVGMLSYAENLVGYLSYIDSHYVAFDVAFDIDKVYEADINYVSQYCKEYYNAYGNKTMTNCDDAVSNKVYLNYTQKYEKVDSFLFWERTYSWQRIEKMSDFLAKENLTEETENAISGMQYVLRFAETEYGEVITSTTDMYWNTRVSEVTLLRLKYEVDGKTYNMGVVANKQSDDGIPDNIVTTPPLELKDGIELLLILILLIILYMFLSPILNIVFAVVGLVLRIIWKFIKSVVSVVISILSFPFKIKGG